MLRRRPTLIISLRIRPLGPLLHVPGMKVRELICYTNVRILLLLSDSKEVCLCIIALVRHRLTVFTLMLGSHVRSLVSCRFELLQLSLIGQHLASEVQVFIVSDLVRVKADSKAALAWQALLILIIILIIVLVIIFIFFAFDLRCLMTLLSIGISLAIEHRSVRLEVPLGTVCLGASNSPYSSPSGTTSCHVEVLKLQLLDPRLQSSVVLPQLNKLSVDSINGELLVGRGISTAIQRGIHIELAVLGVALGKYALDIIGDELLIVFSVILEDALDELQPLSESLILDVEGEHFSV